MSRAQGRYISIYVTNVDVPVYVIVGVNVNVNVFYILGLIYIMGLMGGLTSLISCLIGLMGLLSPNSCQNGQICVIKLVL